MIRKDALLTNERLYRIAHQGYDTHSVSSAASYALRLTSALIPRCEDAAKTRLRATRRAARNVPWWNYFFVHLKVGRQVLYVRWKRKQLIKNSGSKR